MNATARLSVKTMMRLHTAKTDNMNVNVTFLSNLENNIGTKSPQTAMVKVNELTYSPETAIEVEKYSEICEMIPTMLSGVLMAKVDIISMYRSIFGFLLIIFAPNIIHQPVLKIIFSQLNKSSKTIY